jgi:hypothetical protein
LNSDKLDGAQVKAIEEDVTTFIGILRKLLYEDIEEEDRDHNFTGKKTSNEFLKGRNNRQNKRRR